MRTILKFSLATLSTLALAGCLFGNTSSTRSGAGDAGVDAGTDRGAPCGPTPAPSLDRGRTEVRPDDGLPAPDGNPPRRCNRDGACEADEVCVWQFDGDRSRCVPRSAFPADVSSTDYACYQRCEGACGTLTSAECGVMRCPGCGEGERCDGASNRCEPDPRPQRDVYVTFTLARCDTSWDRCTVSSQLCTPTLPDPFVRVGRMTTAGVSNRCEGCRRVGLFAEEELRAGVRVSVVDDDRPASSDVICAEAEVRFTDEELAAGRKVYECAGGAFTFTLAAR